MNLAIIYGGTSFEREVSIKTANSILSNIDSKYNVVKIDFDGDLNKLIEAIKIKKIEIVFNALHGGDGENGVVQKVLEENDILFTGSGSSACEKAMNKAITRKVCKDNNIPIPEGLFLESSFSDLDIHDYSQVVLKPIDEGSSADLYIIPVYENYFEVESRINFMIKKYGSCLLEKYIGDRELTVGVLDDNVLPIVEIVPKEKFYDYKCKYTEGMSEYLVPANLDDDVKKTIEDYALKLHDILGCRHYSRIDVRLDNKNNIYILEINTLPGMTKTSLFPKAAAADGIEFKELINKIIDIAIND